LRIFSSLEGSEGRRGHHSSVIPYAMVGKRFLIGVKQKEKRKGMTLRGRCGGLGTFYELRKKKKMLRTSGKGKKKKERGGELNSPSNELDDFTYGGPR